MEWLRLVQCPVCRGDLRHDRDGVFTCDGCGTTYPAVGCAPDLLVKDGPAGYGDMEVDYDYHLRHHHGSVRRLYNSFRRPFELELLKREADRLGRALDVLDVGCGDPTRASSYHRWLLPLTRTYIGLEPSLPIVSRVRPLQGMGMLRAVGELPVVRDHVVDVAICWGALDRCVDPDLVLANMAAALRPGGCSVIDLVNEAAWYRGIAKALGNILPRHPSPAAARRKWRMSPDDLRRRLRRAGFHHIDVHDLLYMARALENHSDWIVRLLGEQRCTAVLRRLDQVGRYIAPGRGGMFIAVARKLQ